MQTHLHAFREVAKCCTGQEHGATQYTTLHIHDLSFHKMQANIRNDSSTHVHGTISHVLKMLTESRQQADLALQLLQLHVAHTDGSALLGSLIL